MEEKGPGFPHSSGVENVPHVQAVVIVDTGHLKHTGQKNTIDSVITGILLSPARMVGLRQNVCCVESSVSGSILPIIIFVTSKEVNMVLNVHRNHNA